MSRNGARCHFCFTRQYLHVHGLHHAVGAYVRFLDLQPWSRISGEKVPKKEQKVVDVVLEFDQSLIDIRFTKVDQR
jgi:hypothetical protein